MPSFPSLLLVFDQNLSAVAFADEKLCLIKFYKKKLGCLCFFSFSLELRLETTPKLGQIFQEDKYYVNSHFLHITHPAFV